MLLSNEQLSIGNKTNSASRFETTVSHGIIDETMNSEELQVRVCRPIARSCRKRGKKRSRAPSRKPVKKIHSLLCNNSKIKLKVKSYIRNNIPQSSGVQKLVSARFCTHVLSLQATVPLRYWKYRLTQLKDLKANEKSSFFMKSKTRNHIHVKQKYCFHVMHVASSTDEISRSVTERFCISQKRLLTSGDIELNAGPDVVNVRSKQSFSTDIIQIKIKSTWT